MWYTDSYSLSNFVFFPPPLTPIEYCDSITHEEEFRKLPPVQNSCHISISDRSCGGALSSLTINMDKEINYFYSHGCKSKWSIRFIKLSKHKYDFEGFGTMASISRPIRLTFPYSKSLLLNLLLKWPQAHFEIWFLIMGHWMDFRP